MRKKSQHKSNQDLIIGKYSCDTELQCNLLTTLGRDTFCYPRLPCWNGIATASLGSSVNSLCSLNMYLEGYMSLLKSAPGQSVSSRAWASSSLYILLVLLVLLQCGHLDRKQTNKKVRISVSQEDWLNITPAPIQCRSNGYQSQGRISRGKLIHFPHKISLKMLCE